MFPASPRATSPRASATTTISAAGAATGCSSSEDAESPCRGLPRASWSSLTSCCCTGAAPPARGRPRVHLSSTPHPICKSGAAIIDRMLSSASADPGREDAVLRSIPAPRRRTACALALLAGLVAGGCVRREAAVPRVAASIFPLYDIARRVAGDRLKVDLVLPPGHTTHYYD